MHIHKNWADTVLAINELTKTHGALFGDISKLWKQVGDTVRTAEDDHQRHLALDSMLKDCLLTVSEYTTRKQNQRDGYDLQLECFTDRFKHLYPLRDDALAGVRYVSFYNISRECYSPAEGGCWFDRHQLVATLPLATVLQSTDYDQVVALTDPKAEVKRLASLLLADTFGLTYDLVLLETFPAEHQTLRTPRYE